jgi:hypothetical protein
MDCHTQLRKHVRSVRDIDDDCRGMIDVPTSLFNEHVQCLASFCEEDYQGTSHALYTFADKYFIIEETFGSCSGCDGWMDASSEDHQKIIDGIVDDIAPCDNIWEIPVDLDYTHPTWRNAILEVMEKYGCLEKFHAFQEHLEQKHETKQNEWLKEQEDKKRLESERQEADRKRKMCEETKDCEESLLDLVKYFEKDAQNDPFFEDKKHAKLRQLKYFCDKLPKEDLH